MSKTIKSLSDEEAKSVDLEVSAAELRTILATVRRGAEAPDDIQHYHFANRLVKDHVYEHESTSLVEMSLRPDRSQVIAFNYYLVRPTIEALFFDRPDLFQDLLGRLIEKDDQRCYEDFFNRLNSEDIDAYRLCEFNQKEKEKWHEAINLLHEYGQQLQEENDNLRAERIFGMALEFNGILTAIQPQKKSIVCVMMEAKEERESGPVLKAGFEILKFKLSVLQTLRSLEKEEERRQVANPKSAGFWYVVANVFSTLLLGIPFLVNYLWKGQGLFRPQTWVDKVKQLPVSDFTYQNNGSLT